jgi:AcrR family transcriptional regulator
VGERVSQDSRTGGSSPHDRIVRAAFETIADKKLSGTRMREIARRSGISQGHLTYYFATKSSLLFSVLDFMLETFVEQRRAALDDASLAPADKLDVFFQQEIRLIRHHADLLKVRLDFLVQGTSDAAIEEKLRQMYATWRHDIEQVVAQGVQQGVFSAAVAPLVPSLLIALMEGALLQYLNDPASLDLGEYFATSHRMVLGLLTT